MTAPTEPKWQLVLYARDDDGVMVERGHVVGWFDFAPFLITPENRAAVMARYWVPTVEQFRAMLPEPAGAERR